MFAFYYPYADALSGGAPTPAARLALEPPAAMQEKAGSGGVPAKRSGRRAMPDL